MNLESGSSVGGSLVGLKLLHSQDNQSLSKSLASYKKDNQTRRDKMEGRKESIKPGHTARMRKRQIERGLQDLKNRSSEEGTSMGAILIATSSLKSEEEREQQNQSIEIVSGQFEDNSPGQVQKKTVIGQISTIFRPKIKKQKTSQLEPVRIIEDGSDLSLFSTPSPSHRLKSFAEQAIQIDQTDRYDSLSVNTEVLLDKCKFSVGSEAAVSPISPMFIRKASMFLHNANKTNVISSPRSKKLQRGSRTATQPAGHYYR